MDSIDDRLSPEEEAFLDQVDGQSGAPGEVEQHNLAEQEEFDWGQFDDFDLNHAAELEEERDRYRQGMKDYMEEKEDEDEEGDQLEDAFHELQAKYDELGTLRNIEWIDFIDLSKKLRNTSKKPAAYFEIRTTFLDTAYSTKA